MGKTRIEWSDMSWPIVTGCSHAGSPGCDMCYAARMAATRLKHHPRYAGLATLENGRARWTGEIRLNHNVLEQPLRWRKPRMIFVCSMSDLFHKNVPPSYIGTIVNIMKRASQHMFQILTKRPQRMLELTNWLTDREGWPANVWLGVSIENQAAADERIPWLLRTPAAVRYVNVEPMLSKVDIFTKLIVIQRLHIPSTDWKHLDWVICGGESGPGARPMHPDWARSLRDQCQVAGTPYFFKQHGAWLHESQFVTDEQRDRGLSSKRCNAGDGYQFIRIGKKRAGRLLDGRTWDEMPEGG